MPICSLPVIGIVSRFAAQKGFDLIAQIMDRLAREEMIIVALGNGDKTYEDMFLRLQQTISAEDRGQGGLRQRLAHKIEAGSDMFLMPSRYEPCGLNQIYSLKYGTVPIVRATGGLDDTIEHWDPRTGKGNRLQVHRVQRRSAAADHQRGAAGLPRQNSWQQLMRNGMNKDFSWNASAKEYIRVYERVRQARGSAAGSASQQRKSKPGPGLAPRQDALLAGCPTGSSAAQSHPAQSQLRLLLPA